MTYDTLRAQLLNPNVNYSGSLTDTVAMVTAFNNAACPGGVTPTVPGPVIPTSKTVTTCNGAVITETELKNELVKAGYGGPYDVPSMLLAFARATLNAPNCARIAGGGQPIAGVPDNTMILLGGVVAVGALALLIASQSRRKLIGVAQTR